MKLTTEQLYSFKRLALGFVKQMGTSNVDVLSYEYTPDVEYGLGAKIELTLKNKNGFMLRFLTNRLNIKQYTSFESWLEDHKTLYEVSEYRDYGEKYIKYDKNGKYYAIPWEDIPSDIFVNESVIV